MELALRILYMRRLIAFISKGVICLRFLNKLRSCNQLILIPFDNNNLLAYNSPILEYISNTSCKCYVIILLSNELLSTLFRL